MESIKGKQLDETFIGLRAKITGDTFTVEGGISDLYKNLSRLHCQGHNEVHESAMTTLYVNGAMIILGPEATIEVEYTPTQLEAQAETPSEVPALAEEPRAAAGMVGHISGFAITIAAIMLMVLLALGYGLQSTEIYQTLASIVVLCIAGGMTLRLLATYSRVTRWVA